MPPPIPLEEVAILRRLLFGQLAESNRDLTQALADATLQINEWNLNTLLAILTDAEREIHSMCSTLIVFRKFLES